MIGGALPSQAQQADVEDDTALQVELWQRNQAAAACGADTACGFLRHIFPLVRNRQISGNVVNAVDGARLFGIAAGYPTIDEVRARAAGRRVELARDVLRIT